MTKLLPLVSLETAAEFQPPADGFIHISPFGEYPIERQNPEDPDGEPLQIVMVIDSASTAAQIAAFNAERDAAGDSWGGMLVDFDHFSLDVGQRSEAAGWATELAARADGLWAKIRWSDAGLKAITGGTYRYTSPVHLPKDMVYVGDNRGRPMRLFRLALTNDPRMLKGDFRMQPISSRKDAVGNAPGSAGQKGTQMETIRKALLLILALPETATDEELLQAATKFAAEEKKEPEHQEPDEAAGAETDETKALKSRAEKAEKELAGLKADSTLKVLEGEGYKFTSRDKVRERLVADHDNTLALVRLQPPPEAKPGEPLRNRGTPPAGAGADVSAAREEAVAAAQKKYGLKSRAAAVTRAQKDHPELWK